MRTDDQGRRLCSAHTKAGNPCRAPAVTSATVCRLHGAAKGTPGREAADKLTLSALIAPSLLRLADIIEDETTPPAAAVAAIRTVLDRTGHTEPRIFTDRELVEMLEAEIVERESLLSADELAAARARQAAIAAFSDKYDYDARHAR
jgi:hypothetical protein